MTRSEAEQIIIKFFGLLKQHRLKQAFQLIGHEYDNWEGELDHWWHQGYRLLLDDEQNERMDDEGVNWDDDLRWLDELLINGTIKWAGKAKEVHAGDTAKLKAALFYKRKRRDISVTFAVGETRKSGLRLICKISPPRPSGLSSDAVWNQEENEWELGRYNGKKQPVGYWQWWRPNGILICESHFNGRGKLHGWFMRYHPDGTLAREGHYRNGHEHGVFSFYRSARPTEDEFLADFGVSSKVWKMEIDYNNGGIEETRYFLKDGRQADEKGKPIEKRVKPAGVPAGAWWEAKEKEWIIGRFDKDGHPTGCWKSWYPDGTPASESHYVAFNRRKKGGKWKIFHPDGSLFEECSHQYAHHDGAITWWRCAGKSPHKLPGKLSDKIWKVQSVYKDGKKQSTRYFLKNDTEVDAKGRPVSMPRRG